MKKKLISIILTAVMFASLLVIPASAASTVGARTTTALNLRKSASTSAAILMTMPKDAELIVLSSSDGWSKVVYNDTIGYASKKYLTADSSVSGKFGTGTVSGDSVRMRKGAGTSYAILGTYNKGTKMTVTGAKNGWYKVSYSGKTGYVSADYMTISVTAEATTYPGVITASSVRMRSGAGTSYSIIGTYDKGTKMTVTGSKNGWYKVSYNGKTGYVSGDYMHITPKTAYNPVKSGTVTGNDINLRLGPSTSFSTKNCISKGTEIKISGLYGSWYEVSVGGTYGYMSKSYINISTTTTDDDEKMDSTGTVTGDSVCLRKGPGTNYDILGYYNSGTVVKITGKTGNWYAVTIGSASGYMSADYVKIGSDSVSSNATANQIIATAKQYMGVPYVYGGASPSGFDCSGLVYYVFHTKYGYPLERGAGGQYNKNGTYVSKDKLQPADLVFFSDSVDPIGHVGIYIGDGNFIHASSGKGCVTINNLSDYYYSEHYTGAKRII